MSNLIFSQKSKTQKFKNGFPLGKRLRIFITGKGFSVPQKLSDFSKKMLSKNTDSSFKNLKKYIKAKDALKRPLVALIKSYEQNINLKSRIFKSYFPKGKLLENILTENSSDPFQKLCVFFLSVVK